MISSIGEKTIKQYSSCYKKWWDYCLKYKISLYKYNLNLVLNFLLVCFDEGLSYSSINTYRSSLALILNFNSEDGNTIKRFLKGVYNRRPSIPKYSTTWDPNPVLLHLAKIYPLHEFPLKDITQKLVTLLALTSASRVQTISKITLKNIVFKQDKIEIKIEERIKTSGPNKSQPFLVFPFFLDKPELCVAKTLEYYISITKPFRKDDMGYLILTNKKPFHPASTQSISRWIKEVLQKSGIDTSIFTSHSVRHASTSAACRAGLNIDLIKNTAGWTQSSSVFATFYNRPLVTSKDNFANSIIRGCSNILC